MRFIKYIILGIILFLIGLFVYFFLFIFKVPALEVSQKGDFKDNVETIDQWFESLQKEYKFNGAVLMAERGQPLLMKGYGITDASGSKEINAASSFRLASVSKQFTAAGILTLVDRGLIQLDDPVVKHIPEFKYPLITIQHLLNQTSGLPDNYMALAKKKKNEIDSLSITRAATMVIEKGDLPTFDANTSYQYSNTNYLLLAYIVEQVSGQSFEDYMREQVFEPLGMNHTRVWNLFSTIPRQEWMSAGISEAKSPKVVEPSYIDGVSGDGGIFCSLEDFLIWDNFWRNDKVVSLKLKQLAQSPNVLEDGSSSNYGFGWINKNDISWHNGSWMAANTYIWQDRKAEKLFVILDNSSNIFFGKIIKTLQENGFLAQ